MSSSPSTKSSLFSSLTLSRGARAPKPAAETLTHPLLGASTSSLNVNDPAVPTSPGAAEAGPSTSSRSVSTSNDAINVPYKPRQKGGHGSTSSISSFTAPPPPNSVPVAITSPVMPPGVSGAPTTSTSATFALPLSIADSMTDSTATSRLQLQSLKAAAQRIGLSNGSMGMFIIDAIYEKGQSGRGKVAEGGEWAEILKVLSSGKGFLLLPSSPSSSLPITPQVLRDHIAYMSSATISRANSSRALPESSSGSNSTASSFLVTLSGLVAHIQDSDMTIESVLSTDSPLLQAVLNPLSRSSMLASLRPTSSGAHFPKYTLSPENASLAFPPLNRSSSTTAESKPVAGKLGRINPFSLFGSAPAQAAASSSTPPRAISPPPLSPKPSLLSLDNDASSIRSESMEGYTVTAYTISKPLRSSEINKGLAKAVKSTIREQLPRFPDKAVDRVVKLVIDGICPSAESAPDVAPLHLDFSDPTTTGERLQDFIEAVYDDLVTHFRADSSHLFAETSDTGSMIRRKASWTRKSIPADMATETDAAQRKEKMRRERDATVERDASEGAEKVEGAICRLLYNRLFSPLESDDSRHDEVLSSRIAALNMLDLSLDHLGLITRPAGDNGIVSEGLARIVEDIGDELQKLSSPSYMSPKEKSEILIKAHTLVADGLAKLPAIDLRPDGEPYRPPTPLDEGEAGDKELPTVKSSPSVLETDVEPVPISVPLGRRASSGSSTHLSVSPAQSDPLAAIDELTEKTPQALITSPPTEVPHLVLPDSDTASASAIDEAMSESVMTLTKSDVVPPRIPTSGADLILPIIIYAVVKSNPPQLASQLMYLRRYRSAICLTGEASYAIVNLTAVVEFLEHVDLAELGLGDSSDKVISVEDLSPIGLDYLDESNVDAASIASASSRLRGRVTQVGELAGSAADSANKVLTGVVDSSWTALRGFISNPTTDEATVPEPVRPGMRPRQASTFSLASVTASVATIAAAAASRSRSRANSRASALVQPGKEEHTWKGNEEMVEVVSRPASVREKADYPSSDEEEEEETELKLGHARTKSDTRSIRSVGSALSRVRSQDQDDGRERVSISDRLANIGVLGRLSNPAEGAGESPAKSGYLANLASSGRSASGTHSRRLSLLGGARPDFIGTPNSNASSLPTVEPVEPPIEHFMTCEVGDIRLSEIGLLLRDYRRLAAAVSTLQQSRSQPS